MVREKCSVVVEVIYGLRVVSSGVLSQVMRAHHVLMNAGGSKRTEEVIRVGDVAVHEAQLCRW